MTDPPPDLGISTGLTLLRPVDQVPMRDLVADALRRSIHMGFYAPGERLPTERDLAGQLEVARGNVRAALRLLADEGLLTTTRGRNGGSTVTGRLDAGQGDELAERYLARLRDAYEFRLLIEPAAAALAADRADDGKRRELTSVAGEPYLGFEAHRDNDTRFHLLIARASRNAHLVETIGATRDTFFRWALVLWGTEYVPLFDEITRISAQQHTQIAEAIADGDAVAARSEMTDHLRFHEERFGDSASRSAILKLHSGGEPLPGR